MCGMCGSELWVMDPRKGGVHLSGQDRSFQAGGLGSGECQRDVPEGKLSGFLCGVEERDGNGLVPRRGQKKHLGPRAVV